MESTPSSVIPDGIERRLTTLRQRIATLAQHAGRAASDVCLIAVSKTHTVHDVAAAVVAGLLDFGENTVQDALTKIPNFPQAGLNWHYIGHLQSNKAKEIPGRFSWVHSLDSLSTARKLSQAAQHAGVRINALLQVNVTADERKFGMPADGLFHFVESVLNDGLEGLALRGLMTIGPHNGTTPAPESEQRQAFARLRELGTACRDRFDLAEFTELSMGMSGDYPSAIAEGATLLRIGSQIFGARIYSQAETG